jgi:hypothetical protein
MEPLNELGDRIARDWLAADHDEEVFADLAADRLSDAIASDRPGLREVAAWIARSGRVPAQDPRSFGQPPINVYTGHKFHIEVLLWLDSTAAIHQHSFSGAFGVLEGSSLHSRYVFDCHDRVCGEVLLGELRFASSELLRPGDVRAIEPGRGHLHSLFHLDRPSLSVVVRTNSEPRHDPQYSYLKPGLAIDPFYRPQPLETQVALLESLAEVDRPLFGSAALALIRGGDFWVALRVIALALRELPEAPQTRELVACAVERHGDRIDHVVAAAEEQRRQADIVARRATVRDPEHRFFLALLLNAPNRDVVFDLIANRVPGADPPAEVVGWVRELAAEGLLGLDFDALSLKLLDFALHDVPFADVREAIGRAFELDAAEDSSLASLWDEMHSAALLEPLFATPPSQAVAGR